MSEAGFLQGPRGAAAGILSVLVFVFSGLVSDSGFSGSAVPGTSCGGVTAGFGVGFALALGRDFSFGAGLDLTFGFAFGFAFGLLLGSGAAQSSDNSSMSGRGGIEEAKTKLLQRADTECLRIENLATADIIRYLSTHVESSSADLAKDMCTIILTKHRQLSI